MFERDYMGVPQLAKNRTLRHVFGRTNGAYLCKRLLTPVKQVYDQQEEDHPLQCVYCE